MHIPHTKWVSEWVSDQFLNSTAAQCRLFSAMSLQSDDKCSQWMYQTEQMNYNTREKPIYSCTNEYLSENITRTDCIKELFNSSTVAHTQSQRICSASTANYTTNTCFIHLHHISWDFDLLWSRWMGCIWNKFYGDGDGINWSRDLLTTLLLSSHILAVADTVPVHLFLRWRFLASVHDATDCLPLMHW